MLDKSNRFFEAGKIMYPEPVYLWDETAKNYQLRKIKDIQSGIEYQKYRYVLPSIAFSDIGSVYIPEPWVTAIETYRQKKLERAVQTETQLQKVLFYGYNGIEIYGWLMSHISEIVQFFHQLKTEWDSPGEEISTQRYYFKEDLNCCEKNIALCLGQLSRFGGKELLVAFRIANAGDFATGVEL